MAAIDPHRLDKIRGAILAGRAERQIKADFARRFRCSERQITRYIEKVRQKLLDEGADIPKAMLLELYQKATRAKKFGAAAGILKRIEEREATGASMANAFKKLGPPPLDDALELQAWTQKANAVALYEAMVSNLPMREMLAQMAKFSRGVNASTNHAALFEATEAIKEEARQIERPKGKEFERAPLAKGERPLQMDPNRRRPGRRPLRPPPDDPQAAARPSNAPAPGNAPAPTSSPKPPRELERAPLRPGAPQPLHATPGPRGGPRPLRPPPDDSPAR
jgi:hypothetical protein